MARSTKSSFSHARSRFDEGVAVGLIRRVLDYLFPPRDVLRVSASRPRSPSWGSVRRKYLASNRQCKTCGTKERIEVHHVKPYHLFPALELDANNLMSLCERCHLFVGHLGDWRAWNPQVREHAELWRFRIEMRSYF